MDLGSESDGADEGSEEAEDGGQDGLMGSHDVTFWRIWSSGWERFEAAGL